MNCTNDIQIIVEHSRSFTTNLDVAHFIATNEEEALWVSFSDGNGTGAGALFLKKIEEEVASSWDIASF